MRNELGDVRRSQVITSHGPGSIIDFRAGGYGGAGISVVAAGLEEWDRSAPPPGLGHPQTVYEPRLQKQLKVDGFRLPPVAPQEAPAVYSRRSGKLVGVRFPKWLQCPKCHTVRPAWRWGEDPGDAALYCAECSQAAGGRNRIHVVPVRFIVMCENGHLEDFPWNWWVKHAQSCSKKHDLKLEGSATAGLAGLILSCVGCSGRRPMEGCFASDAIPTQCQGQRPWLGKDADEACTEKSRVVQRGASNIYFSAVESALDIPPWSDDLQKKIGMRWAMLEQAPNANDRLVLIRAMRLPAITNKPEHVLVEMIEDRIKRLQAPDRNIRWEEYQQFVMHSQPFGENTEFEIRPAVAPPELAAWLEKIVRATRLREVRALRGFTRVFPPTPGDESRIAKIALNVPTWLPAVENRGEGLFLRLNQSRLKAWEEQPAVISRVVKLKEDYEKAWRERGREGVPPRDVTPRLVLIHSLAHVLMKQLSLSCGYNSASLRERLYVDSGEWEMGGLLIFTSSPDADGTLGGLSRQGESRHIIGVFEQGLASMKWCSSDPLCIEGIHALSSPANGAACHSCLLASETSCEEFNSFLDRALIVGAPGSPELGYFSEFMTELHW